MLNFPTMPFPQTKQTCSFRKDAATTRHGAGFNQLCGLHLRATIDLKSTFTRFTLVVSSMSLVVSTGENPDLSCHCCGGVYTSESVGKLVRNWNIWGVFKRWLTVYIYIHIFISYKVYTSYFHHLPSRFLMVCLMPNLERCRCQGLLESHVLGVLKEYGIKAAGWEVAASCYHSWRPNSDATWGDWQQRTVGQANLWPGESWDGGKRVGDGAFYFTRSRTLWLLKSQLDPAIVYISKYLH